MKTTSRAVRLTSVLALALGLSACDGILNVDESDIIIPQDLDDAGPASIAALVNGLVGNYQEAFDDVVRYTALMTDEMVSSASFPTRLQVDRRRIQQNNSTITGALYTPLHQARHQADTTVFVLQRRLNDTAYSEVLTEVQQGIALGKLYGGYARVWLAELYCWSILTGVFPEAAPLLPEARMRQALVFLKEAETQATLVGLQDVRMAAVIGQARAYLWLRDFNQAAALASQIPRDFIYWAEYSHNSPEQYNEMYQVTWGDIEEISWTVGNGESPTVGSEKFELLDQFVALNLLRVRPAGFTAVSSNIPVVLQTLYRFQDSNVMIASGFEAMLIRAEAAVRAGQTAAAAALLNDLRADFSLRTLLYSRVALPPVASRLQPITLTGNARTDLRAVANERARELWLTGDRFTTSRRLRNDPLVIDLFPPVKTLIAGGDDTAFPMVQLELDTNTRLKGMGACPAGQSMGSWR